MAACVQCSSLIVEERHSFIENICPEVVSVIEQLLGYQLNPDAEICSQCLAQGTRALSMQNEQVEQEHELPPETIVCIWCRSSLFNRQSHAIPQGPVRNLIAERIHPRQIPPGGLTCYACWVYLRRLVANDEQQNENAQQVEQVMEQEVEINANQCVRCLYSLARRRRHSLPAGPVRDEIAARISPRQIPEGGLVCYSCWSAARQYVQRRQRDNDPQPAPGYRRHYSTVCGWCQSSLFRQQTHSLPRGPERDYVLAQIHPRELHNNTLLCIGCWSRAIQAVQARENIPEGEQGNVPPPIPEGEHGNVPPPIPEGEHGNVPPAIPEGEQGNVPPPRAQRVSAQNFRITTRSSSHCFVPGCLNIERLTVPNYLRKHILRTKRIYLTSHSRVCEAHKITYDWDDILNQDDFSSSFTVEEMEEMTLLAINEGEQFIDFENIDNMDEGLFRWWTGVLKIQFMHILENIPLLTENCKRPKTALGLYLIKCRTGDSHERIGSLLQISKGQVCKYLSLARNALKVQFVPLHLGVNHSTRDDFIRRNLTIPEGLFGDRENRKVIIIVDGTYVYLQKSSNYLFQKKTYSLHKYWNLVKPLLFVAPDGHILDIFGPYPATTSDADIMRALFQDENSELRLFFREQDIFILDRGFRDSISLLENIGYIVHKPESTQHGESQLSTERANKSRCVTLCRWVVEVVNGRFKRDYKLFRNEFFNTAATHLMDDFRICGAIINAFHREIVDRPDAQLILNRARERLHMPNELAAYVISNNINRRRAQFISIDEEHPHLDIFPQMSMSDLILFALGTYQIKQARSYYGEHVRQHGTFAVEVSSELEGLGSPDTVLLRGRIRSRHISSKEYYSYILLRRQANNWDDQIVGYYCNCICGKRTVGCCAHTMTIIWYLGWARHQETINVPAPFLDGIFIREDVENEEIDE